MSIGGSENLLMLTTGAPAELNWSIGLGVNHSFDNRIMKPSGQSSWRRPPDNVLLSNGPMFIPFGTHVPLRNEEIYQSPPDDSMFVFSRNKASPECCPSTYSTSGGCVCTTPGQRKFIAEKRGNNKSYPSEFF